MTTRTPEAAAAEPSWAERSIRPLGVASLVANIVLVVTGGAVRLTGSGLGCPTWPRCTGRSFTPHGAMDVHSFIEFSNRLLTFVLTAVAVATLVTAVGYARRRSRPDVLRLALLMALGIPAQAVVGGLAVLSDLNPWVVSFHLLVSLAIIGLAVLFLHRLERPVTPAPPPLAPVGGPGRQAGGPVMAPVVRLAWVLFGTGWLVLYAGTVVTGSGPHAGDVRAPRNGLDPLQLSQLHVDLVFLFVGLTVGLLVAVLVTGADSPARTAVLLLLGIEVAQAAVGFVQYFTDLPEVLVGVHMLGAALVAAALTHALLRVRQRAPGLPR